MQEDKIYALEDYIKDYQQLICKYRSENASLKRQLGNNCDESEVPAGRGPRQPASQDGQRSLTVPPKIDVPRKPRTNGTNRNQPLEVPDVPALEQTKPDGANLQFRPARAGENAAAGQQSSDVLTASYTEPPAADASGKPVNAGAMGKVASRAATGDNSASDGAENDAGSGGDGSNSQKPPSHILLRGEVVANDSAGGPRLAINVAPLDSSWQVAAFEGNVSLALMGIDENGAKQKLGRWDFSPQDVKAGVDPTTGAPTLQFHLELPGDTPISETSELWARVVPEGGSKMLATAQVDLTQPGEFTSQPENIEETNIADVAISSPAEDEISPASAEPPDLTTDVDTTINDPGWQTARPGAPVNLPVAKSSPDNGWRAAEGPIPVAVAQSTPAAVTTPTALVKKPSKPVRQRAVRSPSPPSWSPDRSGESKIGTRPPRPRWSATR